MRNSTEQLSLECTQCGSDLEITAGQRFATCVHCSSALYLDRRRAVLHYILARTLEAEHALGALHRWMAGGDMARDLDRRSRIEEPTLGYLPLWMFRVREGAAEQVYVEPAAPAGLSPLQKPSMPAGELRFYDPELAPLVADPSVPCAEAASRIQERAGPAGEIREAALVHVPHFLFRYQYQRTRYSAAVDASSGQVLADFYPTRWALPYRAIAALAFLVFLFEAFLAYLFLPHLGQTWPAAYTLRCSIQLATAMPLLFAAWLVVRRA